MKKGLTSLLLCFMGLAAFAAAPTVSNVTAAPDVPGSVMVGGSVTGSYTYADGDGDPEGASVYVWYRADDAAGNNKVAISGATSISYTPTSADLNKYISFSVTPKDNTGATGTAGESFLFRVYPGNGTGIASVNKPIDISIYPNPVADVLHLQFNDATDNTCNITITNLSGKQVYSYTGTATQNMAIPFDAPAGIYLCEVRNSNGLFRGKLVK